MSYRRTTIRSTGGAAAGCGGCLIALLVILGVIALIFGGAALMGWLTMIVVKEFFGKEVGFWPCLALWFVVIAIARAIGGSRSKD